ncbi:MAG: universal stress protein [Halopenitus sp.]
MYDTILLPVAPNSEATRGTERAADLAEHYDATIHVLAVADTMEETMRGPHVETLAERIESEAMDRVEEIGDELEERGHDVVKRTERGRPFEMVIETIEDVDADIVIMPTHTRKGLQRMLLGSVTEKVLRRSPVPVLTVPMEED